MRGLGACRSVIRELFEYGKKRKAEIGAENVFDFSIGNPSVPSPAIVNETLTKLIAERDAVSLHGYTSAQGDAGVRGAIADYINTTHGAKADPNLIYLTVGAAASLTISLSALTEAGDEVVLLAPFPFCATPKLSNLILKQSRRQLHREHAQSLSTLPTTPRVRL